MLGLFLRKTKKYYNYKCFSKIFRCVYSQATKIWVDKGNEFCNTSIKLWLQDNDIEIYSTHKKGKSVVLNIVLGFIQFDPPPLS